ncbi:NAD+ synthase [Sphingomicrobium sediminis]|uniref:Glutamine-dependent NAD(+) synthetase n=1 Tax=Sphingomicrobium sediminis TaxID=2950949 RepID=A0A9X2J3J7_9SPHN|nr:NAD+ synthase [Sphingomicrobium sediminis]MCM8558115.1 NAD+ synthase [Sphingomicrobium sediminis]
MTLRIALCQMNQRVGDLAGNAEAMLEWRAKAAAEGADLVFFPELQITGYPTEDLVLKDEFVRRTIEASERLADATNDGGPAILFGTLHREEGHLFNAVMLADKGAVVARRLKHELPNYGTFDELRLFAPGPLPEPIEWDGVKLGVPICEDIWLEPVCQHLDEAGADILLVPNGSPYELNKDEIRQALVRDRVNETGLPLVYLNRVGGQDELVFDGSSFVVNRGGEIVVQMRDWDEAMVVTDWEQGEHGWHCTTRDLQPLDPYPEDVYHAMMVGLGDYVNGNGFPGVILGLSGGIDSALSAAIAVDALGPERVWCVMMPSKYTSQESLDDARGCAEMLGCRHDEISIVPGVEAFDEMLDDPQGLTEENIQSRLRMVTLMALSNSHGHMVLTTGNKSEMSVGYATLYGDMAGGYNALKDAYKTTVFELSRWRNANKPRMALGPDGPVMPMNVIEKPPSAELRPDQKDEDSLPAYAKLDRMLEALIEDEASVAEAARRTGVDEGAVADIEKKLLRAEYKRRQAPPGVKIGRRNFGRDRRYPITNSFRTGK